VLDQILDKFAAHAPVAVMVRAVMANILSKDELDRIFRDTAVRQKEKALLFSSVVDLLHLAVLKTKPSVNSAYTDAKEQLGVSVAAVYDKLNGIELAVIRELVKRTAAKMRNVVDSLGYKRDVLENYEVKMIDGSHMKATDHRLDPLRMLRGAPLPGQGIVIFDARRKLVEDFIPCADGHAQERSMFVPLVDIILANAVYVMDANFCTAMLLQEINLANAFFVVRHHRGMVLQDKSELQSAGATETGDLEEQDVELVDKFGTKLSMRRIVLTLKQPTTDGDSQIAVLTNLPKSITAQSVAELYRKRWTIEGCFGEIAQSLNSEINTLCYPPAALLALALGLVTYNVISLTRSAIGSVQGPEVEVQLSSYYMTNEISSVQSGMEIAIPLNFWNEQFGSLAPPDLATRLQQIAKNVELRRYKKTTRGPKKPPPIRTGTKQHISTQIILNNQRMQA
jgi:hypothetical protein